MKSYKKYYQLIALYKSTKTGTEFVQQAKKLIKEDMDFLSMWHLIDSIVEIEMKDAKLNREYKWTGYESFMELDVDEFIREAYNE